MTDLGFLQLVLHKFTKIKIVNVGQNDCFWRKIWVAINTYILVVVWAIFPCTIIYLRAISSLDFLPFYIHSMCNFNFLLFRHQCRISVLSNLRHLCYRITAIRSLESYETKNCQKTPKFTEFVGQFQIIVVSVVSW